MGLYDSNYRGYNNSIGSILRYPEIEVEISGRMLTFTTCSRVSGRQNRFMIYINSNFHQELMQNLHRANIYDTTFIEQLCKDLRDRNIFEYNSVASLLIQEQKVPEKPSNLLLLLN